MPAKIARILVTNDDGVHAEGLRILTRLARQLSDDVWVVAPESEQSGMAHSLTLHRPLRIHKLGRQRYAISGTPTDCVLLAVNHLMQDRRPSLVLSGVNRGANLGEDITYSGTVAAAMEAALLGVPAIAMSQVREDDRLYWRNALVYGPDIIRRLLKLTWPRGTLMNVNYPPVPPDQVTGIMVSSQGRRISQFQVIEARDPFARTNIWIGDFPDDTPEIANTDLGVIQRGAIAATPLHVDLTFQPLLQDMRRVFAARSFRGSR